MACNWRTHLTESERAELIGIDAEIAIARESDRRHTAMREKIRRRCVARGQRLRDRSCN